MTYAAIVRILSLLALLLAAGMVLCALVALAFEEYQALLGFSVTATLVSALALSVFFLTPKPDRPSRPRDGLAVLILWWTFAPLVAVGPYLLAGPASSPLHALHDAVSSLTTTGHAAVTFGEGGWPVSLIVWRAVLHLLGAWATLVAAASIFAAINLGGPGIHRTVLFTIPKGSFFEAVPRVTYAAALALGGVVLGMAVVLLASGAPLHRALADAVSVATTGLVLPDRAAMAPASGIEAAFLMAGLLFSTIGLAVALEVRARRWREALSDPEGVTMAVVVLGLVGLSMWAGLPVNDAVGWSITSLSTSGLPLADATMTRDLPLSLAVVPVIIGGSALSTAGGVKLARLAILASRAGQEFRYLAFRRAVRIFSFRGRVQPDRAIIGIWVYLVGYIMALALTLFAFSLAGNEFEVAVANAVGTLSNAGGLVKIVPGGQPPLADLAAIAAMLGGRLEILAALPAFIPSFWRV